MHDGYCCDCGREELLDHDELCPRCFAKGGSTFFGGDFDADELGLDPEEEYDA